MVDNVQGMPCAVEHRSPKVDIPHPIGQNQSPDTVGAEAPVPML